MGTRRPPRRCDLIRSEPFGRGIANRNNSRTPFQSSADPAKTLEAAYVGSAQAINALGLDSSAVLLGTGVEAIARVNVLSGPIKPYLLAGAGWTRCDVTTSNHNTSDMSDSDDVLAVPVGVGVGYRYTRFIFDARAVLRPTFDNDLLSTGQDSQARLDTWNALLHAGFEF